MNSSTIRGSTGIISPSASTSSVTVQKMKASARRLFIAALMGGKNGRGDRI